MDGETQKRHFIEEHQFTSGIQAFTCGPRNIRVVPYFAQDDIQSADSSEDEKLMAPYFTSSEWSEAHSSKIMSRTVSN